MNNCVFIGRLVREPELKYVGETAVCNFSIAVNRKYKSQGEMKEEVNFLDMVAWDKGAESITNFFKKGDPIIVYSSAKQESWTDKDGQKRNKIIFRVEKFEFPPTSSKRGESDNEEGGVPVGASSAPSSEGSGANPDEIPF
jgi:single-strand DNA-binding protein